MYVYLKTTVGEYFKSVPTLDDAMALHDTIFEDFHNRKFIDISVYGFDFPNGIVPHVYNIPAESFQKLMVVDTMNPII
jgi:hypothetical protein